jgi:hypothetical protein
MKSKALAEIVSEDEKAALGVPLVSRRGAVEALRLSGFSSFWPVSRGGLVRRETGEES